ncbi:unnamed protein product [Vitrella brassicaformis CCMP3155]|uniref:endo-1,4-beta-xylanase n=1 Tax=Vitrella brassicaformis (strain CCMP3155) TaxID=1169540 RepID=A0A0G4GBQ5_VITBC|nr:unnamed protein product [Vitrella brassicaformis CCMP3155]|eukprot:CEM26526.1 unnamed protein product [Vitrella brassicaformis CCMP3155]
MATTAAFLLVVVLAAGAYAKDATSNQGASLRGLKVPEGCYTPGKDYAGSDVVNWKDISSAEHCQSKCQAHAKCAVFNYRDNEKECWLKSEKALEGKPKDDPRALTGPKTCFPECYEEGVQFESKLVLRVRNVLTAEACQHLCQGNKECNAFTFVPLQMRCKLHRSKQKKTKQTGDALTISGPKQCKGAPPMPDAPDAPDTPGAPNPGGQEKFQLTTKDSFIKFGKSQEGTLRALADSRKLYIGSAINTANMNDQKYLRTLAEQYNMAVAEWECKMSEMAPSNGNNINWGLCDKIADFCEASRMGFRYHALAWYYSIPGWFKGLSPNDKKTALKTFTDKVVDHYVDKALWWDVANEALNDNQPDGGKTPKYREDGALYPAIPDWVSYSFHLAHKALSAKGKPFKLYYNDYGVASMDGWSSGKSNAMFNMVKGLAKDNSIDGVGFQLHINTYYDLVPGVRKNIQRYGELGLEVQFTELDVGCGEWQAPTGEMVGGDKWVPCPDWDNGQAARQAEVYSRLMAVCLEEPNCTAFVMWGVSDKNTWLKNSRPLLYDENYAQKPAWWAVHDMMKSYGK